MKKLSIWLLGLVGLALSHLAAALNPALGIHNISAYINATSYTSPTGSTSQTSGSSFLVLIAVNNNTQPSVSDTFSNTYTLLTLGSGTNPIQDAFDGSPWMYLFVCQGCTGGTNHEVTAMVADHVLEYVEFIEVKNSTAVDASASGYNGGSTSTLSVAITPTVANDLLIANAGTFNNLTVAPTGSGWTALESSNGTASMGSGYLAGASASSQNALMGVSSARGLAGMTIAFKGASGPTTSPSQFFLGASLWQRPVSLEAMAR